MADAISFMWRRRWVADIMLVPWESLSNFPLLIMPCESWPAVDHIDWRCPFIHLNLSFQAHSSPPMMSSSWHEPQQLLSAWCESRQVFQSYQYHETVAPSLPHMAHVWTGRGSQSEWLALLFHLNSSFQALSSPPQMLSSLRILHSWKLLGAWCEECHELQERKGHGSIGQLSTRA